MKKGFLLLLLASLFMTACSSNSNEAKSSENSAGSYDSSIASDQGKMELSREDSSGEIAMEMPNEDFANADKAVNSDDINITTDRMIIHQAQLQVKVKNFEKAQLNIEKKVKGYGGYVVESNTYRETDETVSGTIIVRIPEKYFQTFLNDAEEQAAEVLSRNVTGQDVTEEYVDLESRLKSKRAVEKRLLDFMTDAKKTEDLLKISSDLAKVQEEIEVLVGRMKYLENQTSFSTIEIYMTETRVIIPGIDNKNLNTWEKTKKQFVDSMNFILSACSALVVFFVGNLPVIVILLIMVGAVFFLIRKRKRKDL
ncbi:DUF4349 domain-containing protein [Lederbergia panacisoli]|uniref:DUF4349 domain-containing protein n=1 Tax=Lederbergia panacisoli TaxID=1255251 RepID=UPI00214C8FD3|nr:DUF4349 domain-containing protein [Lederbergia panacisoli]MCR2821052.1 DUF4349 domain-containing protein [Lederbergia panacisoli]